jgi:hypothetical protein
VSKRYTKKGAPYWYAYHPAWDEFLGEAEAGWFVLGCVGLAEAFAIPVEVMREHLRQLNTTVTADGKQYWHVKLLEPRPGQYALQLPSVGSSLSLAKYRLPLPAVARAAVSAGDV